ncbi:putative Coiled-coil domain-containing protein 66-like [Homarus americanus]|uniref:Putative Coiled-coil domain-containing protein 66-like n=1 Tax=Homarus americanus TaxID=6706 RepID=A0A8J5MRB2_HOMAM|nr:putative Coiled-coil domain-containing protein 66-like [Homarus americanus]
MGMSGFGGAPVYVVMQSPGGGGATAVPPPGHPGGAYIQDLLRNIPYSPNHRGGVTIYELPDNAHQQHRPRQGTDSVPLSATSSEGSRWSASPEPGRADHQSASAASIQDDRSAGRARWGDRGVGVGHLWAPGDDTSPGSRGSQVLPPAWADQNEENVLPGAPLSKTGQRTYARGGGMSKMDPEEAAERERRKKQAEETQKIIKQQLEEKRRQKTLEEEKEKREAAMWEERVREQQEKEAREYQEEIRKKKEKESGPLPEVREEADDPVSLTPRSATTPRQRHHHRRQLSHDLNQSTVEEQQPRPSSPPPPQPQHEQPQQQQQQLQEPQPTTPHPQKVGGDTEELARLLRSLGITPEVLLASSGLLDRGTLLTLLHTSSGQRLLGLSTTTRVTITNRIITTKYRGPPSRKCGTQCDPST